MVENLFWVVLELFALVKVASQVVVGTFDARIVLVIVPMMVQSNLFDLFEFDDSLLVAFAVAFVVVVVVGFAVLVAEVVSIVS